MAVEYTRYQIGALLTDEIKVRGGERAIARQLVVGRDGKKVNFGSDIKALRKFIQVGDYVSGSLYTRGWHKYFLGRLSFCILLDEVLQYPRARPKRKINRDYQRSAVYAWDRYIVTHTDGAADKLTVAEARGLADEMYDTYGLSDIATPSVIVTGRRKVYSVAKSHENRIDLAEEWGLKRWVVIHELSHLVADYLGIGEPAHGPGFVSVLRDAYAIWLGASEALMDEALAERKIDIMDAADRRLIEADFLENNQWIHRIKRNYRRNDS